MKRVFFMLLMAAISATIAAQTVIKTESKDNGFTSFGNGQAIEKRTVGDVTVYYLRVHSDNRFYGDICVELGDKEEAIRLLEWLVEYKGKKGDIVSLNNKSQNIVVPARMLGVPIYNIYESTGNICGWVTKKQLKNSIKWLQSDEI